MIKIGINGLGRIGRAFLRMNLENKKYKIVAINEIDKDIENLAYLLKYDSTYGKLSQHKVSTSQDSIIIDDYKIKVYHEADISKVNWQEKEVDIVIDSSGVYSNVISSKLLIDENRVKKVICTHSPKDGIDLTLMIGVNEEKYIREQHHIISSSICDANAITPFFKLINETFGIEAGEITTLHPWLAYQNLLDGNLRSVSNPGHYWKDYALGRNSTISMIPKETTVVPAISKIIPEADKILSAMSFRTPTAIVSAADGTFVLKNKVTQEELVDVIEKYIIQYPNVLQYDSRSLVSIDYAKNEFAAVIDGRWLKVINGKIIKFILWYDNEWGYASRAYNLVGYL